MRIEKAIESLKNIIEYWTYKPKEVEAVKLAIEVLEKQIPEKPYYLAYSVNPKIGNWNHGIACICDYGKEYCSNCGQRLSWDNKND